MPTTVRTRRLRNPTAFLAFLAIAATGTSAIALGVTDRPPPPLAASSPADPPKPCRGG